MYLAAGFTAIWCIITITIQPGLAHLICLPVGIFVIVGTSCVRGFLIQRKEYRRRSQDRTSSIASVRSELQNLAAAIKPQESLVRDGDWLDTWTARIKKTRQPCSFAQHLLDLETSANYFVLSGDFLLHRQTWRESLRSIHVTLQAVSAAATVLKHSLTLGQKMLPRKALGVKRDVFMDEGADALIARVLGPRPHMTCASMCKCDVEEHNPLSIIHHCLRKGKDQAETHRLRCMHLERTNDPDQSVPQAEMTNDPDQSVPQAIKVGDSVRSKRDSSKTGVVEQDDGSGCLQFTVKWQNGEVKKYVRANELIKINPIELPAIIRTDLTRRRQREGVLDERSDATGAGVGGGAGEQEQDISGSWEYLKEELEDLPPGWQKQVGPAGFVFWVAPSFPPSLSPSIAWFTTESLFYIGIFPPLWGVSNDQSAFSLFSLYSVLWFLLVSLTFAHPRLQIYTGKPRGQKSVLHAPWQGGNGARDTRDPPSLSHAVSAAPPRRGMIGQCL